MANGLYDKGREGFLDGSIDWDTDNIKAVLVTSAYVADLATHQFLSSVGAGTRLATSGNLGTKTVTAGVADAADVTYTAASGGTVAAVVIYKDTGAEGTSRLICFIDTGTNLPLVLNGGDVTIQWSNGSNRIFKL